MQAMLLAAGFGTRLRPYTLVRPKPLFPICNIPLLHILLDKLVALGCERIVVNCHLPFLEQKSRRLLRTDRKSSSSMKQRCWEPAAGLRKALEHFQDGPDGPNGPVLVMNGDIYHDIDLSRLVQAHAAGNDAVTMALHDCPRFNSVLVQQDRVRDFLSSKEDAEEQTFLAFTGIHIVNRAVLEAIPQECFFHIIDLYRELAKEGEIGFSRIDGSFWQDMGTPDDYLDLHRHLLSSRTPSWQIHESAIIGKDVQFNDWGAVGPRAVIGDGARLARCVIWEDAEIAASARLRDTICTPTCTTTT